jgi:hypothetical protein
MGETRRNGVSVREAKLISPVARGVRLTERGNSGRDYDSERSLKR